MPTSRVRVTLPAEVARDIDRLERDRSQFVIEAVQRELKRRRREGLNRSLRRPHPESRELAEMGMGHWGKSLPREDPAELLDLKAGKAVRWAPDKGWIELDE